MTKKQAHYTVSLWRGMKNYECTLCAFSTLDQEVIEQHYLTQHAPPPSPILLADASGREIHKETKDDVDL